MEVTSKLMNEVLLARICRLLTWSVNALDRRLAEQAKNVADRLTEQDEKIEELEGRIRDLEAGSYGDPPEDPVAQISGEFYGPYGWEDEYGHD